MRSPASNGCSEPKRKKIKQNKTKQSCESSFECESCQYKASFATVLKAHMTRKHKHFQCEICLFECSSSGAMESHANLVHKTEVLRSDSHISNAVSLSTARDDRELVQNHDNDISEDDFESESETLC